MLDLTAERNTIKQTHIEFEETEVPVGVERIDPNNKAHFHYVGLSKTTWYSIWISVLS